MATLFRLHRRRNHRRKVHVQMTLVGNRCIIRQELHKPDWRLANLLEKFATEKCEPLSSV